MKEGDVGIAHGANWYGPMRIEKIGEPEAIAIRIVKYADHREYQEHFVSADGTIKFPPIFVQRLKDKSLEEAERECKEIWERRTSLPALPSKQAKQAREAVLAKTDFRKMVEAHQADDLVRAAKEYSDVAAAFSGAPHEDDKASVVARRKLIKQRKGGHPRWHSVLVAHWDELLGKTHGEISQWLKQQGEGDVETKTIARFLERLPVKRKKATK
jgi:hypothetical protein